MEKKKVGLALGAGSARGLAHIGVLQVLEEHSIPVDLVAGSSMGSVVGGIYACGTDLYMMRKLLAHLDERDFFDIIVPRKGGFIRGQKFQELIRTFTKNYSFEHTRIPFCCTAVDLLTGRLVELKSGKIDEAIRASISIPGVFEPVHGDGVILVDGGLIARVPGQTARDMGADVVIGVDVGYRGGSPCMPIKGAIDYLWAALDIIGWEAAKSKQSQCDIMLMPHVQHTDPNSFKDVEVCIDEGRRAALEHIDEIKALVFER